jgi:hypothetical protein
LSFEARSGGRDHRLCRQKQSFGRAPASPRARVRAWGRVAGGASGAGPGLLEAQLARKGAPGIETRPFTGWGWLGVHSELTNILVSSFFSIL